MISLAFHGAGRPAPRFGVGAQGAIPCGRFRLVASSYSPVSLLVFVKESCVTMKIRVSLIREEVAESPRECDNLGTMACWHTRYDLGDVQPRVTATEYIEALDKGELILPLYLYDHSGITISTSAFSCPWDSGQVGIIHVSAAKIRTEFGDNGEKARDKARAYLKSEVAVYDQFNRGEVYGYIIERSETCDHCGKEQWETVDSCWGFYGADPRENGIIGNIDKKYHNAVIEAYHNNGEYTTTI